MYPYNAEHHGKADGTDCGQEDCLGFRKEKRITSPKPRRIQSRQKHLWKRSQIRIRCLRRIPVEGTNSGRGGRSGRCVQQSAIQTADGTPCAIWCQLDTHKMARSNTPGKKGCHTTWKLDLHAPTTDNGTSTRFPSIPIPRQCLHKGTGGSEQQWFACGRRACLQSKHMRYPLDLPSMEAKHKAQQVKAYLNAMHSPKNPLLDAVKEKKGCRLARDKSWMGKAKQSIQHKQARDWEKHPVEFKPYYKTQLSDLGVGDHVSSGLVDSFP